MEPYQISALTFTNCMSLVTLFLVTQSPYLFLSHGLQRLMKEVFRTLESEVPKFGSSSPALGPLVIAQIQDRWRFNRKQLFKDRLVSHSRNTISKCLISIDQ